MNSLRIIFLDFFLQTVFQIIPSYQQERVNYIFVIIMNIFFNIRLLINDSWPLGCYFFVSMFPCFWWKYSWNSILHNDYILTLIWSCIHLFNKNVSLLPLLWTITYHKSYHIVLFLHYRLSLLYLWNNVVEFFLPSTRELHIATKI